MDRLKAARDASAFAKAVRKKCILKPCLMLKTKISAKVLKSCFPDPFSLQSKQLQPNKENRFYLRIKKRWFHINDS
jgi:hypothetical protein